MIHDIRSHPSWTWRGKPVLRLRGKRLDLHPEYITRRPDERVERPEDDDHASSGAAAPDDATEAEDD